MSLTVATDAAAMLTLEVDLAGTGVWSPVRTIAASESSQTIDLATKDRPFPAGYWLRLTSDRPVTVTASVAYE